MKLQAFFISLLVAGVALSQSFSSGSTGADGALELTNAGTVDFDPHGFRRPPNTTRDDVFYFTTIHIAKDVVVKLSSKSLSGPVFWLAQGQVQIDGIVDLSGANGGRTPSTAGAGGFPGGSVGKQGYGTLGFTPNAFLVPLVGGLGGNGGDTQGGGAGGGALLIASSASITVNGAILANGGSSLDGAGGNGGAIRLVAPVIEGRGSLAAKGGQPGGAGGRIRFEAFKNQFTGTFNETAFAFGRPFGLFLPPTPPPSVRIVSIDGSAVSTPDINVSQPASKLVVVEAHNIPPSTVVVLECFSERGALTTVATMPLEGIFERSLATASLTFPSGLSHCYAQAHWQQPPLPRAGR
jgi:hypothetical protein